jgi:hypothetical protein
MAITINGSGTVTGISAGGLPDASIVTADIADANITAAKLSGAQTGSAPIYGCRAWVNFDGTRNEGDTGASTNGANVKIRASGNVSSVLKNGTGDYTITFTTAMVDANYSVTATATTKTALNGSTVCEIFDAGTPGITTGSVRVATSEVSTTLNRQATDRPVVCAAIFR